MRYIPTLKGNKWITRTTGGYNMGIHDQTQFKSAVEMLEDALDNWDYPALNHLVLTGASELTYKIFIQKLSDSIRSPDRKHWKFAMEADTWKGLHGHVMLVLSADDMEGILGDSDTSTINKLQREIQATEPAFEVMRVKPKKYNTQYIPINEYTLNDAADWMSYIFKVRSKPLTGGCYGSSRKSRTRYPADRESTQVKQMRVFKTNYSSEKYSFKCSLSRYKQAVSTLHVGVNSSARHPQLGSNRSFSNAIRNQSL